MKFYSAKTNAIYDDKITVVPDDAVEISDAMFFEIAEKRNSGFELSPDKNGNPTLKEIEISDDARREAMVISKVKAMQNLKKAGKLNAVLDLMDTLPRDNDMRILWDFSENLRRTDATLVTVCKDQLGLDDLGIDNLFM